MREKCVLEFFAAAAACAWIERFYQQGMDISMKLIRKKITFEVHQKLLTLPSNSSPRIHENVHPFFTLSLSLSSHQINYCI